MLLDSAVLAAVVVTAALMLSPNLRKMRTWRAMVTPLASIIGSGFLILGPLLQASYGAWAPAIMAILCLTAWAFGGAIRENIAARAARPDPAPAVARLDRASEVVLAFAYVISVAYYLNLFGAFGTRLIWPDSPDAAKWLTSAVFLVILAVGWLRGFKSLERMEYLSVTLKLAIIAGLLVGLAAWFWGKLDSGALVVLPTEETGWSAVFLAFGLLVTVQGFETSRYLGEEYSPAERIRSMRWAQIFSTLIYMVYTAMLAFSFAALALPIKETAIIDLMGQVSRLLPILLVIAALAAQFSAAVADTAGAGGLTDELTRHRLAPRHAYAVLVGLGLFLTWSVDIFEIIAYASRAFAAYYALQNAIAMLEARQSGKRGRAAGYLALTALALAIVVFGKPAEGG
ncbi:MAG TPA: hypothetical protein ENJ52_06490 [Aliiroseovarius sp.]|nr:hypothetical protein [Aliiroseovarius sp.]